MDALNYSRSSSTDSDISSDMTTPHRVAHMSTATALQMQQKIVADFSKTTYEFKDFTRFVKTMWKLTDAQLALFDRRVDSHAWALNEQALTDFKTAVYAAQKETFLPYPESLLYEPFQRICNLFLESMENTDAAALSAHPIRVWQDAGNGQLVSRVQHNEKLTKRKPDLLFLPQSHFEELSDEDIKVQWGRVVFPMEVSKQNKLARGESTKPAIAIEERAKATRTINFGKPTRKASRPLFHNGVQSEAGAVAPRLETPMPTLTTSLSRKRSAPDGIEEPNAKRRAYTQKDAQLGTYVTEMFEATYRFFCCGLSLRNDNLRIWYYDTMGTLSTVEFTFTANPRALMLMLFGMRLSDPRTAGYNPFHKSNEGTAAFQWKDSYFEFEYQENPEDKFKYLADGDTPLFIAREVSRRRTAVLPVLGQDVDGHHSLLLALKFSWLARNMRRPETETVNMILQRAPELARYLPKFHFHRLYNSEHELGLPRYGLTKRVEHVVDTDGHRDLLVSVASRYAALWQVDTIEDFKTAFIDVVKCHYKTFTKGKVLHRDVSEGNIMFGRDDQGLHGVLLDFDNASDVDANGDVVPSTATHRTGTAPFMAKDLMSVEHPVHLYRHDLESFFYFLVWAAVHFDIPNKRRLPVSDVLSSWYVHSAGDFKKAMQAKSTFFYENTIYDETFAACRPEFLSLWKDWIVPLRIMFYRSSVTVQFAQQDEREVDAKTLCGTITYEKFMKALKVSTA